MGLVQAWPSRDYISSSTRHVESQDPAESDAPTAPESEETTEMQEQEEARVEARKESDYEDSGDDSGMESAESDCDDNEETLNRKLIQF